MEGDALVEQHLATLELLGDILPRVAQLFEDLLRGRAVVASPALPLR